MKFNFEKNVSQENQTAVNGWTDAIGKGFNGADMATVGVSVEIDEKKRELIVLEIPDAFSEDVGRVELIPSDSSTHVEVQCRRAWERIAQKNIKTRGMKSLHP